MLRHEKQEKNCPLLGPNPYFESWSGGGGQPNNLVDVLAGQLVDLVIDFFFFSVAVALTAGNPVDYGIRSTGY